MEKVNNMKHLKIYKVFEDSKDVLKSIEWLESFGIENYTINEDNTIDVNDDVDITGFNLSKIPIKFGKVTGNFDCGLNQLKDLSGCPNEVTENFDCSSNELVNLIGGPQEVGGDYYCFNNKLETLEGCAGDIGGFLNCTSNKLTSLDCSSVINGGIICRDNNFEEEPEFFGICGEIYWK